jgi:hypothetical protein
MQLPFAPVASTPIFLFIPDPCLVLVCFGRPGNVDEGRQGGKP